MSLKTLFGAQVKRLRKFRKMTQEELSEKIEIDLRQLARIEAGESFVTSETIEKICKALNVNYKDIFDVQEETNMTFDSIEKFKQNYSKLNKIINKIAPNDEQTEYIMLAYEAIQKNSAREKLKSILWGMSLK